MLIPTKADPTTKDQSCKQGTIRASDTGGIKMILTFHTIDKSGNTLYKTFYSGDWGT